MNASPMPPEPTADEWAAAEAEYQDRIRARIETALTNHRWDGGYFCRCGRALNSPNGWGRHLLSEAFEMGPEP